MRGIVVHAARRDVLHDLCAEFGIRHRQHRVRVPAFGLIARRQPGTLTRLSVQYEPKDVHATVGTTSIVNELNTGVSVKRRDGQCGDQLEGRGGRRRDRVIIELASRRERRRELKYKASIRIGSDIGEGMARRRPPCLSRKDGRAR
jgi:hypothetical protein